MSKPERSELVTRLRTADNPKVRRKACRALAATHDPEVIPALRVAYLSDDDPQVREVARAALARFKASQSGKKRLPFPGERTLSLVLGALIALFVVSLALHGLRLASGSGGKNNASQAGVPDWENWHPTARDELLSRLGEQQTALQALDEALRGEIQTYNETGQPNCDLAYEVPPPIGLSETDRFTYPDLKVLGGKLDATQPWLQAALLLLKSACDDPEAQTDRILDAARKLDQVEAQLGETAQLLQLAQESPAPTVGPTVTPPPTLTATAAPPSATAPADGEGTATLERTRAATATATATVTPTPTATPTPLPLPALDYPTIVAEIRARLAEDFLLDLQNPYGTGMLDQWQQAISAKGQTTTNYCALSTWPQPYQLSPQQEALLHAPGVADPQLEEALQALQEGLVLAQQARQLYERDCGTMALSASAEQGIAWTSAALEKLQRAAELLDIITARTP